MLICCKCGNTIGVVTHYGTIIVKRHGRVITLKGEAEITCEKCKRKNVVRSEDGVKN